MARRFLDTNILLRYLTRDDEAKAKRALALLQRMERGEERVETSLLAISEVVFTLQRFYHVPKDHVRELITPILRLRGLHLPEKTRCLAALDLYVEQNISFIDAYHAVLLKPRGKTEIYSWDTDFDDITWLARVEPEED